MRDLDLPRGEERELVEFAPVDLVLNAVVRQVDLSIEVRQVVLARPLTNLVLVTVWAAVAVRPAAVAFLQELLIFALEIPFEDDAPNLEPVVLVPKTGFLLPVRRIEIRVVVEFALAADARIERL
jgi:hypothetical protein